MPDHSLNYDLSFIYKYAWEEPSRQISEALRLLLSAHEGSQILGTHDVQRVMARHPETPALVLDKLVDSGSHRVLEDLAYHPRVSAEALNKLADTDSAEVRSAVAENRNASQKTLWRLSGDPSPDVRFRLAENPHAPRSVLCRLTADENPFVANRAQRTLQRVVHEWSWGGKIMRFIGRAGQTLNQLKSVRPASI